MKERFSISKDTLFYGKDHDKDFVRFGMGIEAAFYDGTLGLPVVLSSTGKLYRVHLERIDGHEPTAVLTELPKF